jgi:hypothetical protein
MPLNYDLSKVKSYKRLLTEQGKLKEPYSTIILLTMQVGMRHITVDNYRKFYNRLHLIETLNGCFFFTNSRKPVFITREQVERMIGLSTNASDLTAAKFIKLCDWGNNL